jgi:hypothetical protein
MKKFNKITTAIASFTIGLRWKNHREPVEDVPAPRQDTKHRSMVSLHVRKASSNSQRFSTGAIENWPSALVNANSRDTSMFGIQPNSYVANSPVTDLHRGRLSDASEDEAQTFMEFTTRPQDDLLQRHIMSGANNQYNSRKIQIPYTEHPRNINDDCSPYA